MFWTVWQWDSCGWNFRLLNNLCKRTWTDLLQRHAVHNLTFWDEWQQGHVMSCWDADTFSGTQHPVSLASVCDEEIAIVCFWLNAQLRLILTESHVYYVCSKCVILTPDLFLHSVFLPVFNKLLTTVYSFSRKFNNLPYFFMLLLFQTAIFVL